MKAIRLIPETKEVALIDYPDPQIHQDDEVKLKVLEVGICGTDRELVSGERALVPKGERGLILGHEMLSKVIEIGRKVHSVQVGDLVVAIVRHGCNACPACLSDRSDQCYTGLCMERGIKGFHGYQSTYAIEREKNLFKLPKNLRSLGVLCEPVSVAEKAIEESLTIQRGRLPDWSSVEQLQSKQALVVGLGPIGLLCCMVLRLRGFKVFGQDVSPPESKRSQILKTMGGHYIDGRTVKPKQLSQHVGEMDLIVEAVGNANLNFSFLPSLRANGIAVFTGIPDPHALVQVEAGSLFDHLVLKNQVLFGSVNAARKHWQLAITDLEEAHRRWDQAISQIITAHVPFDQFKDIFSIKPIDEIKTVLTWDS